MTIKISDLAKELNINSKELQEKCGTLGIKPEGTTGLISDNDAAAIKNAMGRTKTTVETKIVKAAPKKTEKKEDEFEPHVTVKAAVKLTPLQTKPQTAKTRQEEKTVTQRPPMGKPIISKEIEGRPKKPMGEPVIDKKLDAREAEKSKAEAEMKVEAQVKPQAPEKVSEEAKPEAAKQPISTMESQPIEQKPEIQKAEEKAPEHKPAEHKPYEQRTGERKPYEQRTGERRPYEQRTGERRPYEQRTGEQRTGERKPYEQRTGEQRTGERKPYEQRTGEQRTGERKPYEQRTGERKPYEPRTGEQRTGERKPYEQRTGERKPYEQRTGEQRPARPGAETRYSDSRGVPRSQGQGQTSGQSYGDRRPQGPRPQGPRPAGQGYGDRKPRTESAAPVIAAKPIQKKDDRSKAHTGKEKDKFAKLESGPSKKLQGGTYKQLSLEKAPKPKKHIKQSKEIVPEINIAELPEGTFVINVPITVAGFCEQVEIPTSKVIMNLMKLGIMATLNQNLDEDTVQVLAEDLGISVVIGKVEEEVVEEGIENFKDTEEDLKPRPPIITVMGHVDHGKTSLLDAIRKTNVTASESGGITQHIGASEVVVDGQKIVFLDTPGHEAFTAMRARGAHITDIAVLVVAADDSVMPQTLESISHAKAAGVPIIVAINKIDKPAADIERVKNDLASRGVLVEDWGGDVISVPVSAKSGEGIMNLLEMILLQAEMLGLRANPNRLASGSVIEARLDKSKGPVATLLVLNGTLQTGQSVVAGTSAGKIRLMTNFKGGTIKKAGPATAVEILGLTEVPEAGDEFYVVTDLAKAKEIAANRKSKVREEVLARNASTSLEKLFSQMKEGEIKELNLIVKGDVQGSVDAVKTSLEKLRTENIRTNIVHSNVGTITESDVRLASAVGAVIIGFNVRPSTDVTLMAERENIEIRCYRVIYNLIEEVEAAMKGMLEPIFKEVLLGKAVVRETFKVPGIGIIAGAYITEGKVVRNEKIRLVRDGIIIHEGKISSLKRMKDDVKEVRDGFECGIGIENYNDLKEGDTIECFTMEEIKRV